MLNFARLIIQRNIKVVTVNFFLNFDGKADTNPLISICNE